MFKTDFIIRQSVVMSNETLTEVLTSIWNVIYLIKDVFLWNVHQYGSKLRCQIRKANVDTILSISHRDKIIEVIEHLTKTSWSAFTDEM